MKPSPFAAAFLLIMNRLRIASGLAALACLLLFFTNCNYEVPITEKPTQKIDEKFLGDWETKDGDKTLKMKIARLDEWNYIVSFDDNLYRAFHSDVAGTPYFSVLQLDEKKQTWSYSTWKIADDGALVGKSVSDKVVPDETRDSATVQKLLKENASNPGLFADNEMRFTRAKKE